MHAVLATDLDEAGQLLPAAFPDAASHAGVACEDFRRQHAAGSVFFCYQALRYNRREGICELCDDLRLLLSGEGVDDAVDGFWGVDGVKRSNDQMPRLCGGDG